MKKKMEIAPALPVGIANIEFAQNPECRCACQVIADRSLSMKGNAIGALNEGLNDLRIHLLDDPLACLRVELALISFNDDVIVEIDFTTPENFHPPTLVADGGTALGASVLKGLDMLKARVDSYRAAGLSYFRPWLVVITDAESGDDTAEAARRVKQGETDKRLAFFGIGVQGANMTKLAELSLRPPLHLEGLQFKELFQWLSSSLSSVASSQPGDQVPLPKPDWATV